MRITVLIENTVGRHGLLAELGLAFWIDLGARRILFDTGQSVGVLTANAQRLGIDPASADAVLLSHGHYDHSGGLAAVLPKTRTMPVYAHPAALEPRFVRDPDGGSHPVGMPEASRSALRRHARLVAVTSPVDLGSGLSLTGPVPRITAFEDTGGPFFTDPDGRQPDPLLDDQSAFLETPEGLVVLLGCAHAGIINTLLFIRTLRPETPFRAVLGGMHLRNATQPRLEKTVAALRELAIGRLHPLHCIGFPAAARLWNDFPGRVATCPVGTTFDL
jgi:7,8-dihydropterin-6-yl-methyl-4-(beta-D-ribofuranosyl)aminobenzene 5'-phosphate synthase